MAVTLIEKDDGGRCPFYRHRDAILLQVAADSGLSGAAVKVAIMVAQKYLNRERFLSGDQYPAWPSNATLEEDTGLNKTTVLAGIKQLETRGHMRVKRAKSKGRNSINHYGFVIKPPAIGGENTTNKALKNGGEKTTNNQSANGGENTTIKAANGGEMPPLMVVKTPPDSIDEYLDDAGARSRAPQASESSDDSRSDQSKDDSGDTGTPEGALPPITAAEIPPETATKPESHSEGLEPWERPPPQWQEELWAGGTQQSEVDGGEDLPPSGGLEFDRDDEYAWNTIAFHVFDKCEDLFDQATEVDVRTTVVLLRIVEEIRRFSPSQARYFGDAFAEAIATPEHRAAAFRHIHWFAQSQTSKAGEVLAHLHRVVSDATRRRAKASRPSEGAATGEVVNG